MKITWMGALLDFCLCRPLQVSNQVILGNNLLVNQKKAVDARLSGKEGILDLTLIRHQRRFCGK